MVGQWNTPPGWYPDPQDPRWIRFWDGAKWTEHVQRSLPVPPMPTSPPRRSAAAHSRGRAWWQSWWVIVPGLVLCLPLGLVPLWLRRGTSNAVKAVVSIVTVSLFVVAVATAPSDENDPASAREERSSATPTPTPTPTPTANPTA